MKLWPELLELTVKLIIRDGAPFFLPQLIGSSSTLAEVGIWHQRRGWYMALVYGVRGEAGCNQLLGSEHIL